MYLLRLPAEPGGLALQVVRRLRGCFDGSFLVIGFGKVRVCLRGLEVLVQRGRAVIIVEAKRFARGFVRGLAGLVMLAPRSRLKLEYLSSCVKDCTCRLSPPAEDPSNLALLGVRYPCAFYVKRVIWKS